MLVEQLKRIPGARPMVRALRRMVFRLRALLFSVTGGGRYSSKRYVAGIALNPPLVSDISDHLPIMFYVCAAAEPVLVVELGTRGGESTRSLLDAASQSGATMLSVDINDCDIGDHSHRDRWHFEQADDTVFAGRFNEWCREKNLEPVIDVLFIDTSHEYEHTCRELAAWLPFVAEKGVVMLHDTNMGKGIFRRLDLSLDKSWNNQRGVIRAIEEMLGTRYDENALFSDIHAHWLVAHLPYSNGLTILKRRPFGH